MNWTPAKRKAHGEKIRTAWAAKKLDATLDEVKSFQGELNVVLARLPTKLLVPDTVDHPQHYTSHPSGVECIQITEHMGFCLGNAIKYIWRADLKADAIEDLKKAVWYINREIEKRTR